MLFSQPLSFFILTCLSFTAAQFIPPVTYSNVTKSPINPNITVAFKSPEPGTCTTVFDTQKQYTGYISLPPYTLEPIQQNYTINTFFWFIEARQNPENAPLTIWLNGGPGSSSMIGLFGENGPCEIVQLADGTYGTKARDWGWDRSSNILYVDQPSQVGFSFDKATEFSIDLNPADPLKDKLPPQPLPDDTPAYIFLNGTFGSGNMWGTTNTTEIAAHAVWHFLQTFLATFPQYNPGVKPNSTTVEPVGVNLFAESYGGMYGPSFAGLFEEQNAKIARGELPRNFTLEIKLSSLGILNGLVDLLVQSPYYAHFAYNNTYGIKAIDTTTMLNAIYQYSQPGGCEQSTKVCRSESEMFDPEGEADNNIVNLACSKAVIECRSLMNPYGNYNHSFYDIRQPLPDPLPSGNYQEYLNYASVQKSIGAQVNYTQSSDEILQLFATDSGDEARGTQLADLRSLLELNVRVAFIYGDADFICNWLGGEAVSLALAASVPAYTTKFPAAGYADIIVNDSYVGGAVRAFGNLSFSRIYDAGHMIPAYQPETAFTLFTRIITGVNPSTGEDINDPSTFSTSGPQNATYSNKKPSDSDMPKATCWIRSISDTCTLEEKIAIDAGKGVVIAGAWYEDEDDYKAPASTIVAGKPGIPIHSTTTRVSISVITSTASGTSHPSALVESTTVTMQPTGVYVATGTPKSNQGANTRARAGPGGAVLVIGLVAGLLV
ncbi:uncharacterized protein K452DRAFT_279562 [Aplosporella prunicola CBS 121167]|uniref:Carboxypeptidase n=1 Tax=Aplosporella prunicola CBS 121167 TaxID=1176127 RepID=A0A6A6B0H9_9PEZI|nr:uncharacterized protein K452DRAFT_279562 [Aplosporella prunicola CBS 121167]KAF2136735.1 hypothetical protein K452DRAFT_279562 [Aplosporella prunicola CBS 121167]